MTAAEPATDIHDPFGALREPDFRRFLAGNFLALLGSQMQATAVGWELYEQTGQALDLGLVGLVQVLPVILLAIPAGQVIDRCDRRLVILVSLTVLCGCSLALAWMSHVGTTRGGILACLLVNGLARTFLQPAKSSLVPTLVPRLRFPNAVTWSTSSFQLATVVGPGIGGSIIGWTHWAAPVYLLDAVFTGFFFWQTARLPRRPAAAAGQPVTWRSLLGGVEFVWRTRLVLGALTLDMFAVLLGGATALLPVFAKDILCVGPEGLGYLRAAPGIGALVVSCAMAFLPPLRRAGWTLLLSVAGFGLATVIFGLTRSYPVALAMLFLTGALDMVSVIIRHTLVQTWTPDEMRGRVSAVNSLFIGISNELGALESGAVAQLFHRPLDPAWGPMVAVVSGGLGTLLVVLATAVLVPAIRRYDRLGEGPDAPSDRD
ncbi:MAG: MFS transporter [Pirellulales bacterium]